MTSAVCVLMTSGGAKYRIANITFNGKSSFFSHVDYKLYSLLDDADKIEQATLDMNNADNTKGVVQYRKVHTARPKLLSDSKVTVTHIQAAGKVMRGKWLADVRLGEYTTCVTFNGAFKVTQPHRATLEDTVGDALFAMLMHFSSTVSSFRLSPGVKHPITDGLEGVAPGPNHFDFNMTVDLSEFAENYVGFIKPVGSVPVVVQ